MNTKGLLIDWLVTPGNYAKRRGNLQGISKQQIQQDVASFINQAGLKMGITRNSNQKQVGTKIQDIESKYKSALSFSQNTGEGIREDQKLSDEQFEHMIKQKFKHFYTLQPIFEDHACMQPRDDLGTFDTNEDLDRNSR